jgi:hypothetical protein
MPGFHRLGVGDVKDPHDRSPEAAKCERPKYVSPTPFQSFRYRDFADWEIKNKGTLTFEVAICEIVK